MAYETNGFFGGAVELVDKLEKMGHDRALSDFQPKVETINGEQYYYDFTCKRYIHIDPYQPKDDPFPSALRFFTLDGMIDYIKSNVEGLVPNVNHTVADKKLILHVENHGKVSLLSPISEHEKKRYPIAICEAHPPEIMFARHLDVERFNTMLLSVFVQTPERDEVFKLVKSMTKEQGTQTSDDGVSQQITVKAGVTLASTTTFQNPVPLRPMRTFTEIEQPASNFTLRVNNDAECALFESDGGAWKNIAVREIKEYLEKALAGCGVVVLA